MLATVKAMAARRVSETDLWRKEGDASAAHQLARKSGTSVGKAREALETAGRLGGLPALEEAARRGEVSPDQAAPIADAASKAPSAERRLLTTAKAASLGELRDACARTKAAAQPDDEARQQAIHASRFLRRRRTADGAGELLYRSTLEEVAEMYAIVQAWADRRFRSARREGRYEPGEAYLADGLLDAVRASRAGGGASASTGGGTSAADGGGAGAPGGPGSGAATGGGAATARGCGSGDENGGGPPASATTMAGGTIADSRPAGADTTDVPSTTTTGPGTPSLFATEPFPATTAPAPVNPAAFDGAVATPPPKPPSPAKVVVRIDWDALVRGWPIDGEVCEIAGLGPVPVAAVRRMIESGDAFLAAVVTRGVDVVNVAHLGRRPTAYQQTGLDWRSPECTTLGCNTTGAPGERPPGAVGGLEGDPARQHGPGLRPLPRPKDLQGLGLGRGDGQAADGASGRPPAPEEPQSGAGAAGRGRGGVVATMTAGGDRQ
ncbi:MAG: hypothetical protein ACR2MO_01120, partial [Acidimicrobiales bacterium]